MICMKDLNSMIATEVLKPVFALVDEKVTLQEEREKVMRGIMDVLNAPKGLVSIDVYDVRDLFQEGGVIHAFDVSVDALMANRMNLMMVEITRNSGSPVKPCVLKLTDKISQIQNYCLPLWLYIKESHI